MLPGHVSGWKMTWVKAQGAREEPGGERLGWAWSGARGRDQLEEGALGARALVSLPVSPGLLHGLACSALTQALEPKCREQQL